MALFQKKPQVGTMVPLYTLGQQKAVMVVGLGNIGKEYNGTRHNIGFACLDEYAKLNEMTWTVKKDLKCVMADVNIAGTRVVAIKPTTLMNLSGEAVSAVSNFYKIPLQKILIIHDELDIDFGQIRTRLGGSAGGHNGIKSVIQHMSEDFSRIRIGIGPKTPEQMDSADFVLARFNADEKDHLKNLYREVNSMITEYGASEKLDNDTRGFIN